MACICGHAIEDHKNERGPCSFRHRIGGAQEPEYCLCLSYEDDDEEDELNKEFGIDV